MSTPLFVNIIQAFNGLVAAGAGLVVQWTYTVPAGKRAIVRHVYVETADNANAVNTTFSDIITNGGMLLARKFNDGAGNNTLEPVAALYSAVTLFAGNTLQGRTQNTGAAGVVMNVRAIIEEYG